MYVINNRFILKPSLYHLTGLLIFIAVLALRVSIDSRLEARYPGDLRNRVVGARLIEDGISPYFYKWKKADGIRYYDPAAFDSLKVSNITASPFFLHLLRPVADWPQRTISRFWLAAEYLFFLLTVGIALLLARNRQQQLAVAITAILFLFTESWKSHIMAGQMYLLVPCLAILFYYFLTRQNNIGGALAAGVIAATLVLVRFNTILFFFPFLPLINRYSRSFLVAFAVPVILLFVGTVIDKQERNLWLDYKESVAQQIKVHQDLGPAFRQNEPDPCYRYWEGWDMEEVGKSERDHPANIYSENGNVFVLVRHLLHLKISPGLLTMLSAGLMALIVFTWAMISRKRTTIITPVNIAIGGFCLYMISDLFSPVYRHQYYTVQWLFPLLLIAAGFKRSFKWMYLLLLLGIGLNMLNTDLMKMEHTMGEYLLLFTCLLFSFSGLEERPLQLMGKK